MSKKNDNFILNFGIISILTCIVFYILFIWSSLIIPLVVSVLLAFAILWVSTFFKKKLKMNAFFAMIFAFLTYIFIFYIIWTIISSNINDIIKSAPTYQEKVTEIISNVLKFFNIENPESLSKLVFWNIDLQQILTTTASSITSVLSNTWIIFFYTMFILLEARNFWEKLSLIFSKDKEKRKHIFETINKVKSDVKSYFLIKTFVSFLVWFFSYLVMIAFWLDFSLFWALLIFILNFIPFVWSIIAVIFPSVLSLIQTWFTIYDSVIMISLFIWIQTLVWNFIEPKLMWTRLNLSPLVILLSLSFWWVLWWVWGMLLSIPIMVTINIVLSKIPETRWFAILLSEKWYLQVEALKKEKKKWVFEKIWFKKKKK